MITGPGDDTTDERTDSGIGGRTDDRIGGRTDDRIGGRTDGRTDDRIGAGLCDPCSIPEADAVILNSVT